MARSKPDKPAASRFRKPPHIQGPIQVTDERVIVAGPTDERIMLPWIPPSWLYWGRAQHGKTIPWTVSDAEGRSWTEWHPLDDADRPARRATRRKTLPPKGGAPHHPLTQQVCEALARHALSNRKIANLVNTTRAKKTKPISAKTVGRIRRRSTP